VCGCVCVHVWRARARTHTHIIHQTHTHTYPHLRSLSHTRTLTPTHTYTHATGVTRCHVARHVRCHHWACQVESLKSQPSVILYGTHRISSDLDFHSFNDVDMCGPCVAPSPGPSGEMSQKPIHIHVVWYNVVSIWILRNSTRMDMCEKETHTQPHTTHTYSYKYLHNTQILTRHTHKTHTHTHASHKYTHNTRTTHAR